MKEYRVFRMFSNGLNREVRVFVMLPKTYSKSKRQYPVLYMHDGQNLFDPKQSYGNVSWGIPEAYDNNLDMPEVIIVGIENGGDERSNELVPYKFSFSELGYPEYGEGIYGGMTDVYLDFIVEEVKPYIDKNFRTFKSPNNTGIMGSSFGGLCSTYAATKYKDYFARFGCVSNAYFAVQQELEKAVKEADFSHVKKFYMDVGTKESSRAIENQNYVDSNNQVFDILKDKIPTSKLKYEVVKDAIHNESAWAKRFPDIVKFLFNE